MSALTPNSAASTAATAAERAPTVRSITSGALRPLVGRLAAMSIFVNLLTLAAPIFVLQVYDRVIPHSGYETLKALVIGVLALVAFDYLLRRARARAVQMAALRVDISLSRAVFERLTGLPLRALERRSDGAWRMVLRDVDTVRDQVAGPSVLLAIDLPFAALFLLAIWYAAPPLALVLALIAPVFIAVALISAASVAAASAEEQKSALEKQGLCEEMVAGRATVRALSLGEALRARWESAQAVSIRHSVLRGASTDAFSHLGASLMLLTTVLMTTVGAIAIMNQQMTIGGLIAANMLAARVLQPMTQLIGAWRMLARFKEAAARLDEVLAERPGRAAAAVAQERPSGKLLAENVTFAYQPDVAPALDKLSASFAPGVVTGVVGDNGSGKSTLLKTLLGQYAPQEGRVLLDGADLAQFGQRELGQWFGYAPQDPFLFEGSIRDNILGGRADIDDAALMTAAKAAAADGFIADLPEGFATEVGEGGRRLPPGHRQRIALARALVGDPAVVILDEPSANLDFNAERALCAQLGQLKARRSIVLVSHSTELLRACDLVMVMHAGRIAMGGRSEDVLARRVGPTPGSAPAAGARASKAPARKTQKIAASQGGAKHRPERRAGEGDAE